jgi:hypothetical protein
MTPSSSVASPRAPRRQRSSTARRKAHQPEPRLWRYTTPLGNPRELVVDEAAAGSLLVVDRDAVTLCDRRLVAHIAADEPRENVAIVCDHYLADDAGRFCRLVEPEDLRTVPFAAPSRSDRAQRQGASTRDTIASPPTERLAIEATGCSYRIVAAPFPTSRGRHLRWARRPAGEETSEWKPVSLRDVVGALESYEPPLTLTATALALHEGRTAVSLLRLRSEYERMCSSRVVLNRGLREAVLHATSARGLTFSEIARRCGKVKLDRSGRSYGETSWLARRIGLMPESGRCARTPWVRSEVLALIARQGLGMSPREVEL